MANRFLHSIFGRYLGVDANRYLATRDALGIKMPAYLVGPVGSELAVWGSTAINSATSATTGTAIPAGGITTLSSAATTWSMNAPVTGVPATLFATSSSTGNRVVQLASGTFEVGTSVGGGSGTVTAGSSYNQITFVNEGACVNLMAVSTSKFAVVGLSGWSTAATVFSTF